MVAFVVESFGSVAPLSTGRFTRSDPRPVPAHESSPRAVAQDEPWTSPRSPARGRLSLAHQPPPSEPSVQPSVQSAWSQPGTTWRDLAQPHGYRDATTPDTWHSWALPGAAWHELARLPGLASSPAGPYCPLLPSSREKQRF